MKPQSIRASLFIGITILLGFAFETPDHKSPEPRDGSFSSFLV